jgi:ABC-type Fe3+/spermidine/putrescine transport system ATPase subunit
MVNKPKVLLLKESLAALDYKLHKQIFVIHDQEEALTSQPESW